MSENKYVVTFKMVPKDTPYIEWDPDKKDWTRDSSTAGNLWYTVQNNNGKLLSFGFQSQKSK